MNAGMKNRADPAITVLRMILGQYHTQPGGGTPVAQSDGLFEPRGRMGLPSSTGKLSDGTYGAGGKLPSGSDEVNSKFTGGGQLPSAGWSPVIFVHEDNTT